MCTDTIGTPGPAKVVLRLCWALNRLLSNMQQDFFVDGSLHQRLRSQSVPDGRLQVAAVTGLAVLELYIVAGIQRRSADSAFQFL